MVAADGNEMLADRAAAVGLALAALGVRHDPLHLPERQAELEWMAMLS